MNFIRKWIRIPAGSKEVVAVELWSVRWKSIRGLYMHDIQAEAQFFTTNDDAVAFADQLRAAFELIKSSGPGTHVQVSKE